MFSNLRHLFYAFFLAELLGIFNTIDSVVGRLVSISATKICNCNNYINSWGHKYNTISCWVLWNIFWVYLEHCYLFFTVSLRQPWWGILAFLFFSSFIPFLFNICLIFLYLMLLWYFRMRPPCLSLLLLLLPLSQCTRVDPRCEIPNADKIDCAPFEADCAAAVLLICTLNIIILVVFDMTRPKPAYGQQGLDV